MPFIDLITDFWSSSPIQGWIAFVAIGLLLERLFPAQPQQPSKHIWFNIRYGTAYLLVIFVLSPVVFSLLAGLYSVTGEPWINLAVFSQTSIGGQILAGIVSLGITDFFYYWFHRAQHRFDWLWQQHTLHHSDVSLNVTTNMRHHWLEPTFQAIAISLPMAILFNLTPVDMWIVATTISAWAWFIHLNIRLELGPASRLVAGPQVHRIHHSISPEHRDRNFAAYFPIWDILFGTYYAPKKNEFPDTGITGVRIRSFQRAFVYPFLTWVKSAKQVLRSGSVNTRGR
jgi:sterol desaturase/sphingolipid hydroxylase (fatty acid hydroxylase superfamily)